MSEARQGGPAFVASQTFYVTINDVLGADTAGNAFDPDAMTLFDAWASSADSRTGLDRARRQALRHASRSPSRASAGSTTPWACPRSRAPARPATTRPNIGDHSVALPIDIGVTDASRRTPDMPLYTLQNLTTGEIRTTTDPGRALLTGQVEGHRQVQGPRPARPRRATAVLPQRPRRRPWKRWWISTTPASQSASPIREKADLIAFLSALDVSPWEEGGARRKPQSSR